jgi:carboxymethylenebutenolidase
MTTSLKTENVELKVSDGTSMRAYVARPEKSNGRGIMVIQEAFGVNHHMRDVTERFAREGYLAISPEMFHRSAAPGLEIPYDKFDQVAPHFQAMSTEGIQADVKASYDWLLKNGAQNVACTGYCLGGRVSFIANSFLPLKAAISYYGGRIVPDLLPLVKTQNGPLLFFWGGLDKHIGIANPRVIADELMKAGKPFTDVLISYADHAFFCDDRPAYNAKAAKESWALTLRFLENNFA